MQRVVTPELLDTDTGTPREVADSLADLRMINRYFGGIHSMSGLFSQVAAERRIKTISWLDVGGATGDLASLTRRSLSKKGIQLQPVLLDRMPGHMTARTSGIRAKTGREPGSHDLNGHFPSIGGDALALPLRDASFDVVGCCLFIHHLEPEQVIQFVNDALRVARHAVVINDLIRHPLHLALAYAGYALYRSRLTRHDSVASVRRAYTVGEMASMLRRSQAYKIETHKFFPFRMGVIAWKKPSTI
jgi:ubiquinone/menaquinone biosynthesis C-methylase UbiE